MSGKPIELCAADDVPLDGTLKVERDGLELAVYNLNGDIFVTDDACTHGPGLLSEGFIEGEVILCPFHGGGFNIRTGAAAIPPCSEPVRTYAVQVVDGKVLIDRERRAG